MVEYASTLPMASMSTGTSFWPTVVVTTGTAPPPSRPRPPGRRRGHRPRRRRFGRGSARARRSSRKRRRRRERRRKFDTRVTPQSSSKYGCVTRYYAAAIMDPLPEHAMSLQRFNALGALRPSSLCSASGIADDLDARSGLASARFGAAQRDCASAGSVASASAGRRPPPRQPQPRAFDVHVVDRRDVERQQLRDEQAADDREAERPPRFGAGAEARARSAACRRARPSSSS